MSAPRVGPLPFAGQLATPHHGSYALVPHRPVTPNCTAVGMLWPSGDWVSKAQHGARRSLLETTKHVAFCSAHKAGHTLAEHLARHLHPFVKSSRFFGACSVALLRNTCQSNGLVVVIEREIFSMIGSGVLYHASGTEPWTRCRLHPCNSTTDPSCCYSCGECIAGLYGCNCGRLTPSCNAFTSQTWRMGAALSGRPTGIESFYESQGKPWALPVARETFGSIARPMHARYPEGAVCNEHLHLLYRRGLAATRWEPVVEWADPAARTAAVAAEMLRFLIKELPTVGPVNAALNGAEYSSCSLRLCLTDFTGGSEQFARSSRLILERAGVHRDNWPAAMEAMAQEDTSLHPSGHSTARVVPPAARADLEQEARQLDKELLGGLLSRQLYGTRCASAQPAEAEAGSDALG